MTSLMMVELTSLARQGARLAAGCAIGLLTPGAVLLDGWAIARGRLLPQAHEPRWLEWCTLACLISGLYLICFGRLISTVMEVARIESMPMIDTGVIYITVGGPLSRHLTEVLRCGATLGFLCLSLCFRLLHLCAAVALRAPTASLAAGALCALGQRGLW